MKSIRLLTFALLAIFALTACDKDDNGPEPTPGGQGNTGDIVFSINIENPNDAAGGMTRTTTTSDFKTTFADGDQIGLYAVSHASGATGTLQTSGNAIHNVKLTYNATSQTWTPATPLYYKGAQMDFYAYYPYDAAATNPLNITFNVPTDQSTAASYNASDLLSASAANIAKSTTPVNLTFAHKLALVQVEVDPTYIDRNGDFTTTLRGCKAGGAFDLRTGDLIIDGSAQPQTIKMLRVEQSGDANYSTKYTYRALVPAQTVAQGTSLCLMAQNGQLYNTPTLTAALALSAGDAKLYTAKLPATALQTVKIPAGTFLMGSSNGTNIGNGNGSGLNTTPAEPNRSTNETQHKVTLTKDFYMGKYQVTNAQYAAFLNAKGSGSDGKGSVTYYKTSLTSTVTETQTFITAHSWGLKWDTDKWVVQTSGYDNHPVIFVTWFGAKAYADWIGGALPTEAQWEYACRAGTTTAYSYGNTIDGDYMWYDSNSGSKTHPVGEKRPNPWGLYDMHGNEWEWCSDWYAANFGSANAADPATDPTGATTGSLRVLHGGSWNYSAQDCRSAFRGLINPAYANSYIGFRIVLVP